MGGERTGTVGRLGLSQVCVLCTHTCVPVGGAWASAPKGWIDFLSYFQVPLGPLSHSLMKLFTGPSPTPILQSEKLRIQEVN